MTDYKIRNRLSPAVEIVSGYKITRPIGNGLGFRFRFRFDFNFKFLKIKISFRIRVWLLKFEFLYLIIISFNNKKKIYKILKNIEIFENDKNY